jgi:hypothetical protein
MTSEIEQSIPSRGYERLRVCPIPDDDPVGFAVLGLFLFPVAVFGMATAAAFCGFVLAHAFHGAIWLVRLIAGNS